jgi:hypothetical protein
MGKLLQKLHWQHTAIWLADQEQNIKIDPEFGSNIIVYGEDLKNPKRIETWVTGLYLYVNGEESMFQYNKDNNTWTLTDETKKDTNRFFIINGQKVDDEHRKSDWQLLNNKLFWPKAIRNLYEKHPEAFVYELLYMLDHNSVAETLGNHSVIPGRLDG